MRTERGVVCTAIAHPAPRPSAIPVFQLAGRPCQRELDLRRLLADRASTHPALRRGRRQPSARAPRIDDAQPVVMALDRDVDDRRVGVRQRLGDDVVGGELHVRVEALVGHLVQPHGDGERRASARNAGRSPPSERIPGCRLRASSRRSSSRLVMPSTAPEIRGASSGGASACTSRSSIASETSRCCGPSWSSRSKRRRASSAATTIRSRDAASADRDKATATSAPNACK